MHNVIAFFGVKFPQLVKNSSVATILVTIVIVQILCWIPVQPPILAHSHLSLCHHLAPPPPTIPHCTLTQRCPHSPPPSHCLPFSSRLPLAASPAISLSPPPSCHLSRLTSFSLAPSLVSPPFHWLPLSSHLPLPLAASLSLPPSLISPPLSSRLHLAVSLSLPPSHCLLLSSRLPLPLACLSLLPPLSSLG